MIKVFYAINRENRLLYLLIALFGMLVSVNAQTTRIYINNDSLHHRFQYMNPFDVLEWTRGNDVNYKSIFEDTLLKPKILKWFDEHEYYLYEFEQRKKWLQSRPDMIDDNIRYILQKRCNESQKKIYFMLDTLKNNIQLYQQYKDSALINALEQFKNNRQDEKINPPGEAYLFLALVKYPESYLVIKKQWIESEKCINCIYFKGLLLLDDPEAGAKLDSIIYKDVESKVKTANMLFRLSQFIFFDNAFFVSNMQKLLSIDFEVVLMDGDLPKPYNCFIMDRLISSMIYDYKIDIDKHILESSCDDKLNLYMPQIIAASQKLKEKYEENNRYWKKNIPYYISN